MRLTKPLLYRWAKAGTARGVRKSSAPIGAPGSGARAEARAQPARTAGPCRLPRSLAPPVV